MIETQQLELLSHLLLWPCRGDALVVFKISRTSLIGRILAKGVSLWLLLAGFFGLEELRSITGRKKIYKSCLGVGSPSKGVARRVMGISKSGPTRSTKTAGRCQAHVYLPNSSVLLSSRSVLRFALASRHRLVAASWIFVHV